MLRSRQYCTFLVACNILLVCKNVEDCKFSIKTTYIHMYICVSCTTYIVLIWFGDLSEKCVCWLCCCRILTIHIYYNNLITGENLYSKLSLVDLAGSGSLTMEVDSGERATDLLHVMKSLSAYVVLSSSYCCLQLYQYIWLTACL